MLLTLKKLSARLFFPVPFIFLLLAAGLALLLLPRLGRRCRLAGKILLCAGTALFLLLSVFGGGLLKTLTSQYVPLDPETVPAEACTVVVAGSGFGMAESVPPELWFNDGMLLRLHEAGRIARALARRGIDCAVAVSMVGEDGTEPKRRALEAFLGAYGVPPERIGLIEDALNSRQEVIAFSKLPGRKILVSEAFHIPRLMMLSRRYGLDALPAPASQGGGRGGGALFVIPSAERFMEGKRAVYEYLGMLEYLLF